MRYVNTSFNRARAFRIYSGHIEYTYTINIMHALQSMPQKHFHIMSMSPCTLGSHTMSHVAPPSPDEP